MDSKPISSEVDKRLQEVLSTLALSADTLMSIRGAFLSDMYKGWAAGQGKGAPASESSLKMLTSHVNACAQGYEDGVFYAVDLGGSNLRVLRVHLKKDHKPQVDEVRKPIPESVFKSTATATDLFDFIATTAKVLTDRYPKDLSAQVTQLPVGFTFSFPMSQSGVACGKLIEWTKGFQTQGCVNEDPAALLSQAFQRVGAPLKVVALCNDTVGTLMTCAYEFGGCPSCRIGVILGTGTNAAYVDPSLDNMIVNIEWGGFTHPAMKRTSFDLLLDQESPNPGKQHLEKMVSGMYLGELARLALLHVLPQAEVQHLPEMLKRKNGIDTGHLSDFLAHGQKSELGANLSQTAQSLLKQLGEAILNRSADICAAALDAVAEKSLSGRTPSGDGSVMLTVGIDGSLFIKGHGYPDRLKESLAKVTGKEFASKVRFVRSTDGSGVGAAVIAAAVTGTPARIMGK